jgi:hypothetical protein
MKKKKQKHIKKEKRISEKIHLKIVGEISRLLSSEFAVNNNLFTDPFHSNSFAVP